MRLHALLLAAGVAATCGLPAAMAAPDVETFEWSTMTSKGRLGVMVTGLTPELRTYFGTDKDRGVLVARVEERSAAATAGLRVGDVIVEVRGHKIEDGADVIAALAPVKAGDPVAIRVVRDRKPVMLSAKLTDDASTSSMLPKWLRDWLPAPMTIKPPARST